MLVCTVGDVRVWRGHSIHIPLYVIFTLDFTRGSLAEVHALFTHVSFAHVSFTRVSFTIHSDSRGAKKVA